MQLKCSECYDALKNPYLAIISAYKKSTSFDEGPGLGICFSHVEDQLAEIRERYQQQQLYQVSNGLVFLLDVVESASNADGTIDAAAETRLQGRVGYLLGEEMKKYIPKTLKLMTSRLEELRVFVVTK